MDFDEFRERVGEVRRARPVWFGLEADPPAEPAAIVAAEAALHVRLPASYHAFVREYGGGYFALANVFSVEPGSPWNIVSRNARSAIPEFIAISDCGTGDLYGFVVRAGRCDERVCFLDHESDGGPSATRYETLFDLLDAIALRPS